MNARQLIEKALEPIEENLAGRIMDALRGGKGSSRGVAILLSNAGLSTGDANLVAHLLTGKIRFPSGPGRSARSSSSSGGFVGGSRFATVKHPFQHDID